MDILASAAAYYNRNPRPPYVTGTCRFCNCAKCGFDCSGFCHRCYQDRGFPLGLDTSDCARKGRAAGLIYTTSRSFNILQPADILIHAGNGDPYNSSGAVGHEGLFVGLEVRGGVMGILSWESAGSGAGVSYHWRPLSFWGWFTKTPELVHLDNGGVPTPPPVQKEDEVLRIITYPGAGGQWLTNWIDKRLIKTPEESNAIYVGGLTDGVKPIVWPKPMVDNIPVRVP